MKRTSFSLNGLWQYHVNARYMGAVQVPSSAVCVGKSLYSRTFDAPKEPRVHLCFEGITYRGTVTLNGVQLGVMVPYSFYSFDISALLRPTGNALQVEIEDMNLPFGPSEGWENYGGIIREVYLLCTDQIMIDDVVWRTTLTEGYQSAECQVTAVLSGGDAPVSALLKNRRGYQVASASAEARDGRAVITFTVDQPVLWDVDAPCLYTLEVCAGDDSLTQKVGFKDFRIVGQRFHLNGRPLFLKGICRHDMWGDQGHTLTYEQMERDMRMIKSCGFNFVRLVHYPHHRHIVELADEIGLLVSEEPGLWWSDMDNPETVSGALEAMRRCVIRDRNRISIAFWLSFNECRLTPEYLRASSDLCRSLDPTRPVSGANCRPIEDVQETFKPYGFDFYTMHPYGRYMDRVYARKSGETTLEDVMESLRDMPLVFTEWGGHFMRNNPELTRRFLRRMFRAWRRKDGGAVLAGCCYWVWADMYEFGRVTPDCEKGILYEGLVDIHRNPLPVLDTYIEMLREFDAPPAAPYAIHKPAICVERPEEISPLDIWAAQDKERQAKIWQALFAQADDYKEYGYAHKVRRRMTHGPVMKDALGSLGNLPVNIPAGPPIAAKEEIIIPVNERAGAIYFAGNVTMGKGFPVYGRQGDLLAEYVLEYDDGSSRIIPLRNGLELTSVFTHHGPSRVNPIAPYVEQALRFTYHPNFDRYLVNLYTVPADNSKVLRQIRIRSLEDNYTLLIYGVSIRR